MDDFRDEREAGRLPGADVYVALGLYMPPNSVVSVDCKGTRFIVVSYRAPLPNVLPLAETSDGQTTLWVDRDRITLARADWDIHGYQDGSETRMTITEGFTSHNNNISITESPYVLDTRSYESS